MGFGIRENGSAESPSVTTTVDSCVFPIPYSASRQSLAVRTSNCNAWEGAAIGIDKYIN